MIFQEKSFSYYILAIDQILLYGCLLWIHRDVLRYMCIAIISCPVYDVMNFEIGNNFLINPLFYITQSQNKNINISRNMQNDNVLFEHTLLLTSAVVYI